VLQGRLPAAEEKLRGQYIENWEEYEIYTQGSEDDEYADPYMRIETFAPYNYFIVYWENETYDKETMTHTFYNVYVYFESKELAKLLAEENGICED